MKLFQRFTQNIAHLFGENNELDQLGHPVCRTSDFLEQEYLCDLIPYQLFDESKKIYENKASLDFVLEVIPLFGSSVEIQRELSALVREIGEEEASIQCLMFADYRIERFLQLWKKPREARGGIYQKIAERKAEFFKQESLQGDTPPRIFRFIFSYSLPKTSKKSELFLDHLVERKKKCLETFARFSRAFEFEPFQLIDLASGMINYGVDPSFQDLNKWNKTTLISKQICMPGSAIEVRKNELVFHGADQENYFRSFEAVDIPAEWKLGLMGELIGDFFNNSYRLPSSFFIHFGLHFPNQAKTEGKINTKSKFLNHQMKFSSMIKMFPQLPRERDENLYVQRQLLEGEKFVETRLSCGIWAPKERIVKAESTIKALFQKYGFKLMENHFIHLPDFLSSLPMAWGEDASYIQGLKRVRCFRTTLTSEVGSLMPIMGEWWGNSSQGMLLMGRRGQIASWDQFATEGNLNAVIVGPSGSGKSVFMQEMLVSQLGQGARVFILDLGRSFEKLCGLLEGQFLVFSEKSKLNLNPFSFVRTDGDMETLNVALEMVASIISTMAMPSQKINKERADVISTVVKLAWEKKGKRATIDDIVNLITEMSFQSELMKGVTESLKEGLKKFGSRGVYSNYFYGEEVVDFTNDMVVIETEELKNMPDLQAVILQIFIMTISNQILMGNRERRCLICIDEAWDLLKSPQMEGFIESLARRLRKYNGALVVGTQDPSDFERSPGAKAVLKNCNWVGLLGKSNDSINILKKENIIPMDEFKEAALSSLHMQEGKYSEVFIYHKASGFFSVNQLKLDPFSAQLYSTKAENFQAVEELKKWNLKVEEALEWLLLHRNEFKRLAERGYSAKERVQFLMKKSKQGE